LAEGSACVEKKMIALSELTSIKKKVSIRPKAPSTMTAMSVIDFSNESCYMAMARAGRIETIAGFHACPNWNIFSNCNISNIVCTSLHTITLEAAA